MVLVIITSFFLTFNCATSDLPYNRIMNHMRLEITPICVSCDACKLICPENAIISNGTNYHVDDWSCTFCGLCIEVCPVDCIKEITN